MAETWNLVCDQRASFSRVFTWRDLDNKKEGTNG